MMPIEPDRVDEIFYRAEELPPDARQAFLDEACEGDTGLRREVLSLLAAYDATGDDFLERPLIESPESWTSPEGRRLGAFRILREIGRGGMSRVFLAVRDDHEVDQEVAVKILKWGIDTAEVVRRFRRERQILARLEHPYVARFLDGGTTDDGLPYVVMERVEGEPIDRYCESRRLTVRPRLELFRKVCSAVQFAHQNLIVHRDLKPGNVLVTADGTPKLLDFGIAKLLHEGPVSAAAPTQFLTATGVHPMTLAYASPEQIRGEAVTTASDVYSLGVILYQLLTGERPYGGPNPSALELARAVCEDEATKPSTAVGRGGHGQSRHRRLAGDLDSIVLKALEKDPSRRYGSVEQLADDVQRHLEGLTVAARDATLFYRAGRYLRRHRLEVVAVVLVFLVVLGFSIHAVILRDRAIESREQVQAVTKVLGNVFLAWNPEESSSDRLREARELLDPYAESILADTALEPEVKAELLDAIGSTYMGLGLYPEAEPLFAESLRLRREMKDVPPKDLATSLVNLADVRRRFDRYQEAENLVEKALGLGIDTPDLAKILNNLAVLAKNRGDLQRAEKLHRESLAMKIRLLGERHEDVATGKYNLAVTLRQLGNHAEAEELYRESLTLRTELHGERSEEVANSLNSFALHLRDLSKLAEAEDLARRALDLRREIYGEEHPYVATTLNNLATVLQRRGKVEEAATRYQQALEIRRMKLGEEHSHVARVLRNQAMLLLEMDELSQAETTIRRALEIFRHGSSEKEPGWWIADAESVLGECLLTRGRPEEAGPLLEQSYQVLLEELGERAPRTREALRRLTAWRQAGNPG